MDWLLAHFGKLVTVVIVVASVVNTIRKARAEKQDATAEDDGEAQRRAREVQERIRRTIAQRRGEATTPPPPFPEPRRTILDTAPPPPVAREPFGELARRAMGELARRPTPTPPPHLAPRVNRAELEGQEQLAEELRLAEESRVQAAHRAAQLMAERTEASHSEAARRAVAREELLADLRDPRGLRRGFVLREVLGPPVGLR